MVSSAISEPNFLRLQSFFKYIQVIKSMEDVKTPGGNHVTSSTKYIFSQIKTRSFVISRQSCFFRVFLLPLIYVVSRCVSLFRKLCARCGCVCVWLINVFVINISHPIRLETKSNLVPNIIISECVCVDVCHFPYITYPIPSSSRHLLTKMGI